MGLIVAKLGILRRAREQYRCIEIFALQLSTFSPKIFDLTLKKVFLDSANPVLVILCLPQGHISE